MSAFRREPLLMVVVLPSFLRDGGILHLQFFQDAGSQSSIDDVIHILGDNHTGRNAVLNDADRRLERRALLGESKGEVRIRCRRYTLRHDQSELCDGQRHPVVCRR